MNRITENIIKDFQKFINKGFNYKQLCDFKDNKFNFLLSVSDKFEDKKEFNAVCDALCYFDQWETHINVYGAVVASNLSSSKVYFQMLEERKNSINISEAIKQGLI